MSNRNPHFLNVAFSTASVSILQSARTALFKIGTQEACGPRDWQNRRLRGNQKGSMVGVADLSGGPVQHIYDYDSGGKAPRGDYVDTMKRKNGSITAMYT